MFFRFLQIAVADVEPDRVAEDVLQGAFRGNVFRPAPDDDGQLGFEVGFVFGKGELNCAVVRQERAGSLEPDERRADLGPLHFLDMCAVIQTNRDHLARRHRHLQNGFA